MPDNQLFWLNESRWRPANIRLDEDVFRRHLQETSSRCLDQDKYIHLSHRSSENVFVKTNISVLAIRLQDVYKTSSRRPQDVLQKCLQDIFKTSCKNVFKASARRLQDVLKTSSKRFKASARRLQDVLKTSSRSLAKITSRRFQDVSSS